MFINKSLLEQVYLDYVNNYLTIEVMASDHEVSAHLMKAMVDEGRKIHYDKHDLCKDKFVAYLKQTLIPDLKESGREETAKDFETCIKLIR